MNKTSVGLVLAIVGGCLLVGAIYVDGSLEPIGQVIWAAGFASGLAAGLLLFGGFDE